MNDQKSPEELKVIKIPDILPVMNVQKTALTQKKEFEQKPEQKYLQQIIFAKAEFKDPQLY